MISKRNTLASIMDVHTDWDDISGCDFEDADEIWASDRFDVDDIDDVELTDEQLDNLASNAEAANSRAIYG